MKRNEIKVVPFSYWRLCKEELPKMHDAGILKKIGVKEISDICLITIKQEYSDKNEYVTDNDARLRDGVWHSDLIKWLEAGHINFEVIAWMPLPEPYKDEQFFNFQAASKIAKEDYISKQEAINQLDKLPTFYDSAGEALISKAGAKIRIELLEEK